MITYDIKANLTCLVRNVIYRVGVYYGTPGNMGQAEIS